MPVEQAFLDQLAAAPGDDLTRLVYADWLEERGDARADYLRAEVELGRRDADETYRPARQGEWRRLLAQVDANWVRRAGKPFDVWLVGYPLGLKIPVIKFIRELSRDLGVAEAKQRSESLPARVLEGVLLPAADAAARRLGELADTFRDWIPEGLEPRAVARPGGSPAPRADLVPLGPSGPWVNRYSLRLLAAEPGKEADLVAALAEVCGCDEARARRFLDGEAVPLRFYPQEFEAEEARARLAGLATTELQHHPVLTTYAFREPRPVCRVLLTGYDPARTEEVAAALRDRVWRFLDNSLPPLTQDALPICLRSRASAAHADLIRWLLPGCVSLEFPEVE